MGGLSISFKDFLVQKKKHKEQMGKEKPPKPKRIVAVELDLPPLRIPRQQCMEEVKTPDLVDELHDIERDICATKEILAYIETKDYRNEAHLTKDQVRNQISFYTKHFRELLMKRHALRGEVVIVASIG